MKTSPDNPREPKHHLQRIKAKGFFYWINVLILIVVGIPIGSWLDEQQVGMQTRYALFHFVTNKLTPPAATTQTIVLPITNDEYWKGILARRVPIKRDYLGKLVRSLATAEPKLIAVDFDLRSPMPNGSLKEHSDYRQETEEFLKAVKEVSKHIPIVLPSTIAGDGEFGIYRADPAIYDNYDFEGGMVKVGYINLPYDYRKVPLAVHFREGKKQDSFSQAIVRFVKEEQLQPVLDLEKAPYGGYIAESNFQKVLPSELLDSSANPISINVDTVNKLRGNIVIIGAGWSRAAYGRGGLIDTHLTPAGPLSGVYVHANFVEALLSRRVGEGWGEKLLIPIDIVVALLVVLIFVLAKRFWIQALLILLLFVLLLVFSYFSWRNLGYFFDSFTISVLVFGHATYEEIRERFSHRSHQEAKG
ncbi:MAG TPA: CHASE2 domain-containing protein [Pyrinomonadaceae bacterium]|nr:CHASE2 domain-containing protein [Pyrinomonadaceae bacterium]